MATKKKGLGRGLDALLGDVEIDTSSERLRHLPVEYLQRGRFQPRQDIDSERLQELANSISAQGVIQPIVVRMVAKNEYEIIAGERRWRAAQLAGLHEIPVVEKNISDQAAMAMALIENIQREDLNALEQADALHRLLEEFSMTHQQVADAVGKSRAAVTNLIRLLDLHAGVKTLLSEKLLEMGHARALLGLPQNQQAEAARHVAEKGMTVRAAEAYVKALLEGKKDKKQEVQSEDPDIQRLQQEVSERLGALVQIKHGRNGRGRLVINYTSLDELEGVIERLH